MSINAHSLLMLFASLGVKEVITPDSRKKLLKSRLFSPTRPERAEALSPGQRPGLLRTQPCRPVRAKALKLQAIYKAFALTGRLADCHYTQGVALG